MPTKVLSTPIQPNVLVVNLLCKQIHKSDLTVLIRCIVSEQLTNEFSGSVHLQIWSTTEQRTVEGNLK